MLNPRALLLASAVGTVLQVAMVSVGHYSESVASMFALGGMGLSLIAGLLYAMWARGESTVGVTVGGLAAGAICAFLGILVSYVLGDVPGTLLVLGTLSSAATGALGGWLGTFRFGPRRAMLSLAMLAMPSGSAGAQEVRPVVSEAIIDAPIDSVWHVWARSDGLRSWLAPHADIDMRVGGIMRTNYSPEGSLGDAQTIENTILSYEPGRMLSIRVSKAPETFPFPCAIHEMWTVVYLDSVDSERTHVRVVSVGFTDSDESQRMRAFFEQGNAVTLQQLQRRFPTSP